MESEQLKEKYMEYQLSVQQVQQLHQNIESLEKHISDISNLEGSINNLSNIKLNSEVLMPIGGGIFIKGTITENSKLIMNVGSNVFIEKSTDEGKDTIKKQLSEVSILADQMRDQAQILVERIKELQEEFESLRKTKMNSNIQP